MARQQSATPTTRLRGLPLRLACWLLAGWLGLLGLPALAGTLDRAALQAVLLPPLVLGERSPGLPAWPVFRREGAGLTLQGHVFETIDLEPVAGYGGRPVNLLVLLDRDGVFLDVRLLSHAEPMFTSTQGTAVLAAFAQQYKACRCSMTSRCSARRPSAR